MGESQPFTYETTMHTIKQDKSPTTDLTKSKCKLRIYKYKLLILGLQVTNRSFSKFHFRDIICIVELLYCNVVLTGWRRRIEGRVKGEGGGRRWTFVYHLSSLSNSVFFPPPSLPARRNVSCRPPTRGVLRDAEMDTVQVDIATVQIGRLTDINVISPVEVHTRIVMHSWHIVKVQTSLMFSSPFSPFLPLSSLSSSLPLSPLPLSPSPPISLSPLPSSPLTPS